MRPQYCHCLRELGGGGHVAAAAGWNIEINYRYGLRGHWWKLRWLKANFYRTLYLSSILVPHLHRRFRRNEDISIHAISSFDTQSIVGKQGWKYLNICPIERKFCVGRKNRYSKVSQSIAIDSTEISQYSFTAGMLVALCLQRFRNQDLQDFQVMTKIPKSCGCG